MTRPHRSFLICLLLVLLLGACAYQPTAYPRLDVPIYIPPSPVPATAIPTATPDPVNLGGEVVIERGLFAFQPVTVLDAAGQTLTFTQEPTKAALSTLDGAFYYSLSGEPAGANKTAQDCLNTFILRVSADLQSMQAETGEAVAQDGLSGIRERVSGVLLGQPAWLVISAFHPSENCFFMLGIASGDNAQERWEQIGQPAYQKMFQTLRFLNPAAVPVCDTATDPDYGFSPDTPIQVGNRNLYDGRTREEIYLATLRGPQGQEVFFTRKEPTYNAAGVIVDSYEVSYEGIAEPRLLFFDIYTFQPLLVPQGYTCEAAFPLDVP